MKKLKTTKKLLQHTIGFLELVEKYTAKINREYAKNVNNLLKKIAAGEDLDYETLKEKYLVSEHTVEKKETKTLFDEVFEKQELSTEDTNVSDEIILDKIIIDGTNYYYENKDNGKIYDNSSKIVGYYKNKEFMLK